MIPLSSGALANNGWTPLNTRLIFEIYLELHSTIREVTAYLLPWEYHAHRPIIPVCWGALANNGWTPLNIRLIFEIYLELHSTIREVTAYLLPWEYHAHRPIIPVCWGALANNGWTPLNIRLIFEIYLELHSTIREVTAYLLPWEYHAHRPIIPVCWGALANNGWTPLNIRLIFEIYLELHSTIREVTAYLLPWEYHAHRPIIPVCWGALANNGWTPLNIRLIFEIYLGLRSAIRKVTASVCRFIYCHWIYICVRKSYGNWNCHLHSISKLHSNWTKSWAIKLQKVFWNTVNPQCTDKLFEVPAISLFSKSNRFQLCYLETPLLEVFFPTIPWNHSSDRWFYRARVVVNVQWNQCMQPEGHEFTGAGQSCYLWCGRLELVTVLFKTMWGISLRIVLDDLFNNTLSARASSLSAPKFWPREAGVEAAACPSLIPGLSRAQPKVVGCRERGTSCTQGNSPRTKCKMCHFQLETVEHAIK